MCLSVSSAFPSLLPFRFFFVLLFTRYLQSFLFHLSSLFFLSFFLVCFLFLFLFSLGCSRYYSLAIFIHGVKAALATDHNGAPLVPLPKTDTNNNNNNNNHNNNNMMSIPAQQLEPAEVPAQEEVNCPEGIDLLPVFLYAHTHTHTHTHTDSLSLSLPLSLSPSLSLLSLCFSLCFSVFIRVVSSPLVNLVVFEYVICCVHILSHSGISFPYQNIHLHMLCPSNLCAFYGNRNGSSDCDDSRKKGSVI